MNGHTSSNEWNALFKGNDALDSVVLLNSPSVSEQQCVSIFIINPSAGCKCQRLLKSICWVTAEKNPQDCYKHKHRPLQGCLSYYTHPHADPFMTFNIFLVYGAQVAWLLLVHINRLTSLILSPQLENIWGRWKIFVYHDYYP